MPLAGVVGKAGSIKALPIRSLERVVKQMNPTNPAPCPPCQRKYRPIPGTGPQPAPVLLIGERPGETENRTGRVFDGKAGQELDETYLPRGGYRRSDIRCVNAVQCWAENNRTPSEKECMACAAHHLPQEIAATNPEVIILAGGTAARLCPGIVLERHHGIPQHTSKVGEIFGWTGYVIPMFHPALGLHESRWMKSMLEDWERLAGELASPGDVTVSDTDYRLAHHKYDVDKYYKDYVPDFDLYWPGVDTESHGGKPYSIQVSHRPGTGLFIRAEDAESIARLQYHLDEAVLHFAVADLGPLAKMGIRLTSYRDTGQEAYQLGNLPQGLKSLVYRLFRVEMTSWEDTVRPASIRRLQEWLVEAWTIAQKDLFEVKTTATRTCRVCGHGAAKHTPNWCSAKDCKCPQFLPVLKEEKRDGDVASLFSRLLKHTDVKSEYDPWDRLDDWRLSADRSVSHIEARIGPHPILGIGNCTLAEAIQYACGDADYTAQVAVELAARRAGAGLDIHPGDRDQ